MVNRVDGVILGVGIVVLVASVVGVILYDEQSPQEYALSWSQSEAIELDEQTDSGGPDEYTFETNVSEDNLARTEFLVEVTASGANVGESSVEVEVESPEGETESCTFTVPGGSTASTGECAPEVQVNPEPESTTGNGINSTAAEQQALADADLSAGTGTWTTTVTIEGGTGVATPDYDVSLTPTLYTWEVTASQGGPGGRAG